MTIAYLKRKRKEYLDNWEASSELEVAAWQTFKIVSLQFIEMLEKDQKILEENPIGRGI